MAPLFCISIYKLGGCIFFLELWLHLCTKWVRKGKQLQSTLIESCIIKVTVKLLHYLLASTLFQWSNRSIQQQQHGGFLKFESLHMEGLPKR